MVISISYSCVYVQYSRFGMSKLLLVSKTREAVLIKSLPMSA